AASGLRAASMAAKKRASASTDVQVVPPRRMTSSFTPETPAAAQRQRVDGLTGRSARRGGRRRAAAAKGRTVSLDRSMATACYLAGCAAVRVGPRVSAGQALRRCLGRQIATKIQRQVG